MWSPDGQRVAFQSNREGDEAIFVQAADGTGLTRITKPGPEEAHIPEDWAPDGKHLLFAVLEGSEYSLWSVSPDGGAPTRFGDLRSVEPIGSAFSADGKWIAYHKIETLGLWQSSDAGVFVEPFPATGARYQAPRVNRDFQPFWSRDGGTLFYVGSTGSRQLVAVPVSRASGLTFGTPVTFPFTLTGGRLSGVARAFDVMPDGRFIGLVPGDGSDPLADRSPEVHVIVNWSEEVKRLAPANR
jgi:Tol biopolymer transport system component